MIVIVSFLAILAYLFFGAPLLAPLVGAFAAYTLVFGALGIWIAFRLAALFKQG